MYPDDLIALLDQYAPVDAREQVFLQTMREAARLPDACSRRCYDPGHFTVSAFVLSPDRRHVALIRHPKFHRWLQPGGHIEPEDRSVEAAARREIAEELGITALVLDGGRGLFDIDIHDIPARAAPGKEEPAHLHLDLRLCFVAAATDFSGEHEARWVLPGEVHALESDASVLRGVAKLG